MAGVISNAGFWTLTPSAAQVIFWKPNTSDAGRSSIGISLPLETERSKLMGEANSYNQTKSALDIEIAAAMEQY